LSILLIYYRKSNQPFFSPAAPAFDFLFEKNCFSVTITCQDGFITEEHENFFSSTSFLLSLRVLYLLFPEGFFVLHLRLLQTGQPLFFSADSCFI